MVTQIQMAINFFWNQTPQGEKKKKKEEDYKPIQSIHKLTLLLLDSIRASCSKQLHKKQKKRNKLDHLISPNWNLQLIFKMEFKLHTLNRVEKIHNSNQASYSLQSDKWERQAILSKIHTNPHFIFKGVFKLRILYSHTDSRG